MKKNSSILDYQWPGLNPSIWGSDGKMLPHVREFLLEKTAELFKTANFKHTDKWVSTLKLVGSLTTYQYLPDADIDLHYEIDFPAFTTYEKPTLTPQEAHDFLDSLRKEFSKQKLLLPETQHPIEFYFETPFVNKASSSGSGSYDLLKDKWLSPPIGVTNDFDIDGIARNFIDLADSVASEIDVKMGQIKRQVVRIEELQRVLKAWPREQQAQFKKKIEEKMSFIENEIRELVAIRQEVVDKRKTYSPISEQEITFKWLQRFGYLFLISELNTLLKDDERLTEEELPEVKKIITKSILKLSKLVNKYWISPDGTIFELNPNEGHLDWIKKTQQLPSTVLTDDVGDVASEMISNGWVRVTSSNETSQGAQFALEVASLADIPTSVDSFISEHFSAYEAEKGSGIEIDDLAGNFVTVLDPFPSLQKSVNRDRALSISSAFYPSISTHAPTNPATGDAVIPVDPDTISDETTYNNPIVTKPRKGLVEKLLHMFIKNTENPERDTSEQVSSSVVKQAVQQQDLADFYLLSLLPPEYLSKESISDQRYDAKALLSTIVHTLREEYIDRGMKELVDGALTTQWERYIPEEKMPSEIKPYYTYTEEREDEKISDTELDFENLSKEEIASNALYAWKYARDILQSRFPEGEKAIASNPEYWKGYNEFLKTKKSSSLNKLAGWWKAPTNFDGYTAMDFYKIFKHAPCKHLYGGPLWAEVAKTIHEMQQTTDCQRLMVLIDHFHDLGHNTGKLLDKFPEWGSWLVEFLDAKASPTAISFLLPKSSKPVQDIINTYFLVSGQTKKGQAITYDGLFEAYGKDVIPDMVVDLLSLDPNSFKFDVQVLDSDFLDGWAQATIHSNIVGLDNKPLGFIKFTMAATVKSGVSYEPEGVEQISEFEDYETSLLEYGRAGEPAIRVSSSKFYPPKTTWDDPRQDLEPFKPLPVTFEWSTNDKNLNWRYPWRFMKRPSGEHYTNMGEFQVAVNSGTDLSKKKSDLSTANVSKIIETVKDTGGVTWNFSQGNLAGTALYAVSPYPEKSLILLQEPTEKELHNFINNNPLLHDSDNYSLGVWLDRSTGKWYLDVVQTVTDKNEAVALAQKHNQIAIFNLKTLEEIPTGGTGEKLSFLDTDKWMGWWISPEGEVFTLKDMQEHTTWIESKDTRKNMKDYLQEGWIRLRQVSNEMLVHADSEHYLNSPYIFDFLIKHPVKQVSVELEEGTSSFVTLDYEEVIDKGLYKAFKFAQFQSKTAMGPLAGWLAPDSVFYPVKKTHDSWISENLELLKRKYSVVLAVSEAADPSPNDQLITRGWARIDGYLPSEISAQIADISNPPKQLETFIWQRSPKVVILEDLSGKDVALDDFSEGLNKSLLNPAANKEIRKVVKQAEGSVTFMDIDNAPGGKLKIIENPTPAQAHNLFNSQPRIIKSLRWFSDVDGNLYMWDAAYATHMDVMNHFGVSGREQQEASTGMLTSLDSTVDLASRFQKDQFQRAQTRLYFRDKKELYSNISLEASTYTDKEMQKIYDKQIVFNDSPGGGHVLRDWNHSTTDYPKPQDMTREVIRLDILQKPIYRQSPFGMPSYEITWMNSLPQDGYFGDY